MKILALDPSTHCGWAHSCGASGTWDLSVRRDESGGMRLIRLGSKLKEVLDSEGIDLLAYEAARNQGPKMQGALVVQSELQATIKLFCEDSGIEYRGYSPSELKKHATGKGGSGKPAMLAAAQEMWPGKVFVDDNQVDALWLLDLAQSEYQ